MITVKDARQRAKDALSKRMASLAASTAEAEAYEFRLALKVPTERAVLDDIEYAETWARDWAHVAPTLPRNATLAWADRRWSRVGQQRIPTVLELHGAEEVARFVGGQTKHDWLTLQERCSALLRLAQEQSGSATDDGQVRAALKRHSSYLMQASDGDFATLLQVCDWLVINPDSGLRPRQLPIRGVDTKWLGTHRGIVTSFVTACTARPGLGLTESTHTIRMRILDPELHPSGPLDFAATEGTIQALGLKPQVVFVFETSRACSPCRPGKAPWCSTDPDMQSTRSLVSPGSTTHPSCTGVTSTRQASASSTDCAVTQAKCTPYSWTRRLLSATATSGDQILLPGAHVSLASRPARAQRFSASATRATSDWSRNAFPGRQLCSHCNRRRVRFAVSRSAEGRNSLHSQHVRHTKNGLKRNARCQRPLTAFLLVIRIEIFMRKWPGPAQLGSGQSSLLKSRYSSTLPLSPSIGSPDTFDLMKLKTVATRPPGCPSTRLRSP